MKLTYLIYEPRKSSCSTGQTAWEVVAVKKNAKDSGTIDYWKEKDVLLRSWISGTLTEESMHLIVGCSTAKKRWESLEKAYIQATKVINFSRGLGKAPYPTLNQFVYALSSFDIREDEEGVSQQNHNMVFSAQNGKGRGNKNINSRERGFKPAGQGTGSQDCQYGLGEALKKKEADDWNMSNEVDNKGGVRISWTLGSNSHKGFKRSITYHME
ncbi:hypothetical protein KY290_012211 [Solanum tuberosum]|uniref:Uncharacterized protein n=1 Tax=Solanum tuberosum TaxID=4113 RepID=A0ABQ7W2V1_SOLTU|nr:hypothetical protein KY290_012211 [Solanum tuberosum]